MSAEDARAPASGPTAVAEAAIRAALLQVLKRLARAVVEKMKSQPDAPPDEEARGNSAGVVEGF
jgi:hypothetical protein